MQRLWRTYFSAAILLGILSGSALAVESEKPGWYLDAELASVLTGGNSESSTLGVGAKLRRQLTRSEFTLDGGATQTESSLITRTAQGTATDFDIMETKTTTKTAELYFARGWYKYKFNPKFFGYSGVDWLSNKFAGIDSRFLIALGAGNTWKDSDTAKFNTFYSLTYTFQEDVVENPFIKSDFAGVRIGYNLETQLSSSTGFNSNLVADLNLDNTEDIRLDWYNALPVSISKTLQLMPALRLMWRNEPALTTVPLYDGAGIPTDTTVNTPLKKLDTVFTLALVVKLGPKAE